MKTIVFRAIFLFIVFALIGQPNSLIAQNNWETVETRTLCTERHGNAFVKSGTKFYLLGGRGMKPVEIYDPGTKKWFKGAIPPIEISHFQAVRLHGLIYVAKEHKFQKTEPNNSESATFQPINTGGNQGIPVQYISLTGSKDFELDFPYSLPYILAPQGSVSFKVKFSPENNKPSDAKLLIKDGISNNAPPNRDYFERELKADYLV